MATGDPLGLVVTDRVLRSSASYLQALGFLEDGSAIIGTPQPGPEGQLQGVFPQNRGHQQDPHQHRVLHFHR